MFSLAAAALPCGCALLCGCQSDPAPQTSPPQQQAATHLPVAGQIGGPSSEGPSSIDQAVLTDPSAVRLGAIVEDLLTFFSINKAMPAQLDDLHTIDAQLTIVAPNNQPYEYYPQGLTLPNPAETKLLVACDPLEAPNGRRWSIIAAQLKPGQPLTAEVVDIPEVLYRSYLVSRP